MPCCCGLALGAWLVPLVRPSGVALLVPCPCPCCWHHALGGGALPLTAMASPFTLTALTGGAGCKGSEFLGGVKRWKGIFSFFTARSAALQGPPDDVLSLLYQILGFTGYPKCSLMEQYFQQQMMQTMEMITFGWLLMTYPTKSQNLQIGQQEVFQEKVLT